MPLNFFKGLFMKLALKIISAVLLLTPSVFALNGSGAIVQTELTQYASDYQIKSVTSVQENGVKDRKYSVLVKYVKPFCTTNQCRDFSCEGEAFVDSDAVVDFTSTTDITQCRLVKSEQEIQMCVETCHAFSDVMSLVKACVLKCY